MVNNGNDLVRTGNIHPLKQLERRMFLLFPVKFTSYVGLVDITG